MLWRAEAVKHKGEQRILVYFDFNQEWVARLKKLGDARWSSTKRAWHVPDNEENRKRFKLDLAITLTDLHIKKIANFKRWMEAKRYSVNTIKTYAEVLSTFLLYYHDKPLEEISNIDINNFNSDYVIGKKLSSS